MEHSPTQWRAKLLMSEADPCVTCTAKECGENITPDLRGQRPADPGSTYPLTQGAAERDTGDL
jgi:hypothetical protein